MVLDVGMLMLVGKTKTVELPGQVGQVTVVVLSAACENGIELIPLTTVV